MRSAHKQPNACAGQVPSARRLRELEVDNAWIKKLLAEAELNKECSRS
jgi:hypothetical protein